MIYKIVESEYKGFRRILDEKDNKWLCIIGDYVFKFPTMQDANNFVDNITEEGKAIVKKHGGKIISKPEKYGESKSVEEDDSLYYGIKK